MALAANIDDLFDLGDRVQPGDDAGGFVPSGFALATEFGVNVIEILVREPKPGADPALARIAPPPP